MLPRLPDTGYRAGESLTGCFLSSEKQFLEQLLLPRSTCDVLRGETPEAVADVGLRTVSR